MSKKGFLHDLVEKDDPFTRFGDHPDFDNSNLGFIDTGSYALNGAISGSIYGGISDSSITILAGEESVGKTYFGVGILKSFLSRDEGAGAVYYETEGAPIQAIKSRGIDAGRVAISQPDTVQKFREKALNVLTKYEKIEKEERPPLMLILDSLGQLSTSKEFEDSLSGSETADMTRSRLIKSAFRTITLMLNRLHVPMIATNHVYVNMNAYGNPKVQSGGSGPKYSASTTIQLSKSKDRDEKTKEVLGNIVTCKMIKNRWAKENAEVDVRLSYTKGLDRYFGLTDLAVKHGIFTKSTKGITLPDGTTTATKNVDNDPEKFYTKDVLDRLDAAAKKEYSYGEL